MSLKLPLRATALICAVASVAAAGCNLSPSDQRARDEKTRDEVAKATERAKPVIKEAGRKVGGAAQEAAHEARAAAEGVRDGLKDGQPSLVDVNCATEGQLLDLPGIGKPEAPDHRQPPACRQTRSGCEGRSFWRHLRQNS